MLRISPFTGLTVPTMSKLATSVSDAAISSFFNGCAKDDSHWAIFTPFPRKIFAPFHNVDSVSISSTDCRQIPNSFPWQCSKIAKCKSASRKRRNWRFWHQWAFQTPVKISILQRCEFYFPWLWLSLQKTQNLKFFFTMLCTIFHLSVGFLNHWDLTNRNSLQLSECLSLEFCCTSEFLSGVQIQACITFRNLLSTFRMLKRTKNYWCKFIHSIDFVDACFNDTITLYRNHCY